DDDAAVVEALRWAVARGLPIAILGGGSNVVVPDAGFDGLVVRVAPRGRQFQPLAGGTVAVTAAAGEPWDDLVAETVARGLAGLECLSGIPGLAGATPIQNVGAYGQEVAETLQAVRVLDRATLQVRELDGAACAFGYRDSRFKREPDAFVVLGVTFVLRPGAPAVRYPELAAALASNVAPSVGDVRAGCWRCGRASRWCCGPTIRTAAARARSSPTRSSTPRSPTRSRVGPRRPRCRASRPAPAA